MNKQLIQMLLGLMKPEIIADVVVGILWELAKQSDNKLDDKIVKIIAEALNVEID
jgi:hypothetical protein